MLRAVWGALSPLGRGPPGVGGGGQAVQAIPCFLCMISTREIFLPRKIPRGSGPGVAATRAVQDNLPQNSAVGGGLLVARFNQFERI
jgi:hypothetical protein